jgi:hypothetical protein
MSEGSQDMMRPALLAFGMILACSKGHALNDGGFDAGRVNAAAGGSPGSLGASAAVGGVGEGIGAGGIPGEGDGVGGAGVGGGGLFVTGLIGGTRGSGGVLGSSQEGPTGFGGIVRGGSGSGGIGGGGGAAGTAPASGGAAAGGGPGGPQDGEAVVTMEAGCGVDDVDDVSLWLVISQAFCGSSPSCQCFPVQSDGGILAVQFLTFDGRGRISDMSGLSAGNLASWLEGVDSSPNNVWPCLAGTVIPFVCDIGE